MLTVLQHIREDQQKQLVLLVTGIVKAVSPEKIICFGSRTTIAKNWSCFMVGGCCEENMSTSYDLLIVTNNDEKRTDDEIIQMIEQLGEPLSLRVNSIVHKLFSVNEALQKGSIFFSSLYCNGALLYNGDGLSFTNPMEELSLDTLKSRIEKNWNKGFVIAQRFYQTATHCLSNGWYELCLFMLHQAAQHCCMALLRAFMGYRSKTHNLGRLLTMIENFSLAPAAIFPRVTKEENELFDLLRKAYSDARYNEDYTVTAEKAIILTDRIRELLVLAEQLCNQKLDTLDKESIISFPLIIKNETK
jgi:HEPN domain-containing protein